ELRCPDPGRGIALGYLSLHGDRGGPRHDRSRGHGVEDRRRAALLPPEPRNQQGRGGGDDRFRLHRADREGATHGVRSRDESTDPAPDGGLGRMTPATTTPTGLDIESWTAPALARAAKRDEPAWAIDQRHVAAANARALGLPSREHELWRRIDFRTLEQAI